MLFIQLLPINLYCNFCPFFWPAPFSPNKPILYISTSLKHLETEVFAYCSLRQFTQKGSVNIWKILMLWSKPFNRSFGFMVRFVLLEGKSLSISFLFIFLPLTGLFFLQNFAILTYSFSSQHFQNTLLP